MWDNILNGTAWLLYQIAQFVGDWGLAIIIVTILIRLLLFPVQQKQLKSSFAMKDFTPKMNKIREIYAGDERKIQEETQKIYKETGFNPLSGCLPMLVQMPIFIILFQVLRWKLYDYENVCFYNILPSLTQTVPEAWQYSANIQDFMYCVPYLIFMIIFIGASVIPMIIQLKQNPQNRSQTYMMLVIMGVMFCWMAFISPGGVLLYWSFSNVFSVVQQLVTNHHLEKKKKEQEEEITVKQAEVNVERKVRKKRQHKKRK